MSRCALYTILAISACAASADAAITTFTNRTSFNAAVAPTPLTVEDFTPTSHFPVPGNTLNSSTAFGTLAAGTIKPGVTYSMTVNPNNELAIDAGNFFTGGFLDGLDLNGVTTLFPLTASFDNQVSAFGFDTSSLMGTAFNIRIKFSDAPDFVSTVSGIPPTGLSFFGFKSSSADITQVVLSGNHSGGINFALDNFTFT